MLPLFPGSPRSQGVPANAAHEGPGGAAGRQSLPVALWPWWILAPGLRPQLPQPAGLRSLGE